MWGVNPGLTHHYFHQAPYKPGITPPRPAGVGMNAWVALSTYCLPLHPSPSLSAPSSSPGTYKALAEPHWHS